MPNLSTYFLCDVPSINDSVERAILKYKNHPSIQIIKETFDSNKTFSFDRVSSDTIFKEIVALNTKLLKQNADFFSIFVSNAFNESVIFCKLLPVSKLADVTSVHNKIKA